MPIKGVYKNMAEEIQCCLCGKIVRKALNEGSRTGRPWKRHYCSRACYNQERAIEYRAIKRRWDHFQREVWGTTSLKRMDVGKCMSFGRKGEVLARDKHLPAEGFTDIVDFAGLTNQFFIDFIATYNGERVLVDATIKINAYIPKKIKLARALGMRLFIIHVSIIDTSLYFLREVPKLSNSVVKVPAGFIRKVATDRGLDYATPFPRTRA